MRITTAAQSVLTHARPGTPTNALVLQAIDLAPDGGEDYVGLEAVQVARDCAARARALTDAVTERCSTLASRVDLAVDAYAAGTGTATDVTDALLAVPTAAQVADANHRLASARAAVEATGLAALRTITEEEWIAPLRSRVADALAVANDAADRVGITAPRVDPVGLRTHVHPWEPRDEELRRDMSRRHAWEELDEAVGNLHDCYALPNRLRDLGIIPMTPGRTRVADYHWLDLSVLDGNANRGRAFFLANRAEGQPGIYTTAEMVEHGTLPGEAPPQPYDVAAANGLARDEVIW